MRSVYFMLFLHVGQFVSCHSVIFHLLVLLLNLVIIPYLYLWENTIFTNILKIIVGGRKNNKSTSGKYQNRVAEQSNKGYSMREVGCWFLSHKWKRTLCYTEKNCPMLKNKLGTQRNQKANIIWDKGDLELGKDPVPWNTSVNCLRIIVNRPISYDNAFPLEKVDISIKIQVKYVQDIIVARDTSNLGMSGKEVIQVISDIVKTNYYVP